MNKIIHDFINYFPAFFLIFFQLGLVAILIVFKDVNQFYTFIDSYIFLQAQKILFDISKIFKKSNFPLIKDKNKKLYIIQNNNVTIKYHYDSDYMHISNIRNKEKTFSCYWSDYESSSDKSKYELKCILKKFFFSLCYKFNKNTNFYSVLDDIQDKYPVPYNLLKPYKSNQNSIFYREKSVNINTSGIKELASLPGISLILAKRIVKYRETNGDFKTKNEFYEKFNIKPHFQKQIDKLIHLSNKIASKRVNINTADIKELASLPGIDCLLADDIVKYREENGKFKTKNEFYEKFNINISYRRKMRHFIVLSKKEHNIIDNQQNNNDRIIDI